jgi:hypothetical protein
MESIVSVIHLADMYHIVRFLAFGKSPEKSGFSPKRESF